ncbi:cobalamin biosynthesis protein [Actinopolyspora saharensis]|uniref:Cobalamin biosynthesis protein CobD n=1 Tax=Actinopolyspora saharensis TaxID=995062 RepID=A0A1H1D9W9_9ACTN|nr:cobalamin biosynthesis protein [Actinopolyspora saharensis]SDQ73243.1 adenosylcobinamide-phosphate synthase [Actinopolyspora saharensis]
MNAGRAVGLLLGVAADAVLGDPERGHPVAAFGRLAERAERVVYRPSRSAGVLYTGVLVGGSIALGSVVERSARRGGPATQAALTAVTTWTVLGGASLGREGAALARHLESGELEQARVRLRGLCGRRTEELDRQGVARATVESVAENTSDAVIAPLLWGAVGGIPGLLGYRAVNTLDAMVGNPSSRYRRFGWAAARADDVANLLPARATAGLTALCAPVVGGSAAGGWHTRRRDAAAHPSPNAGQVEAAFAGALRIRLGGRIDYGHTAQTRPVLGEGRTADGGDVTRSVELSRVIGTVGGALAAGVALFTGKSPRR